MKYLFVALVCCPILWHFAAGQSAIGIPAIRNYKNADYHAGINIWDIGQDGHGILYFAADDGLLSYDGSYWKVYPLPNKAEIRSLAVDDSGRIYVGAQDEVGYFQPDPSGILIYHSLKQLLPKVAQQFADVWDILITPEGVIFRTVETLFRYRDGRMETFDAPSGWILIAWAADRMFAADKTQGLLTLAGDRWVPVCGKTPTAGLRVTGVMEYGRDTLLLTTLAKGLYLIAGGVGNADGSSGGAALLFKKPTPIDALLQNGLIRCARPIDGGRYALGTRAAGVCIIDHSGKLIQQFTDQEGLQNNDVLKVYEDRDSNIWLGLENGLAFINDITAVTQIRPLGEKEIKSSSARIYRQRLYVGTSNGVYSVPLRLTGNDLSTQSGQFSLVPGTQGQVWSLAEVDHSLLVGHENGGLVIGDKGATPIALTTPQGIWGYQQLSPSGDVIAGTYTGLRRLQQVGGQWKDKGRVSDLYESLDLLVSGSHNEVWASHRHRGVFRTEAALSARYGPAEGLPISQHYGVYSVGHKVVVATEKGVYAYDSATDKFYPSAFFAPIFQERSVESLTEDSSGNIWFVSNQQVGVIDRHKPSAQYPYSVIYFPELDGQTVKGAPFIYPYDRENIFVGSYNGLFHINYSRYVAPDTNVQVLLSAVQTTAEKDSLVFGGYFPSGAQPIHHFANHWNSFRFEYSSTQYAQKANMQFSYLLSGFDQTWSVWSTRTEKDYTNLPYGQYTFSVRARNNLGNISAPVLYTFIVEPAWYQTVWAYLLYALILAALVGLVIKWQHRRFALHQRRHEDEQERLSYLHSLELDRKEKGLITLQNEKLEAELQFKTKELATVTMHLVERGGILSNIREELITVIKKLNIPHVGFEFKNVFRMLTDTEKHDDEWNRFALYFDQVHNDFLSILKSKYPTLSATDLKLCAYLRLNLSSKEIAQLLNISLKGVEISRYRIRKKFQLTPEINLYDFLIEITGPA